MTESCLEQKWRRDMKDLARATGYVLFGMALLELGRFILTGAL